MSGVGDFSGTVTPGRYRLVRPLDRDGGRVHEARHERLSGRFALKLFNDVEPLTFRKRAQVATALRHPGIVQVVDYSATSEGAFVVMEFVEGRSLAAILATSGPMPADRVARLIESMALGLQAAHRQGVAHGRLSPERVFVLPAAAHHDWAPGTERTKIVGFALSNEARARAPSEAPTAYTAPEQLTGDADPQSDQYALAAIAYEMLTGVPAFSGPALRPRTPPLIRELAPAVSDLADEVIRRALSADPDVRWADVYTFSTRLREATDGLGESDEPTRLAPLPLTVSRPAITPAPSDVAPSFDVPVIASVDVDLGTPAPQSQPQQTVPPSGGFTMSPTHHQGHHQPHRGHAPGGPYNIRPTETFSFTDGPGPGPMWTAAERPRRRRSGGGFRLLVLMLIAGLGGYFAVRYKVMPQDLNPIIARATTFVQSLRTLLPTASPDPAPVAAPALSPTAPTVEPMPAPVATAPAAAPAPALRPEVIPISSPNAAPAKPTQLSPGRSHVLRSRRHKPAKSLKPLSAEAAAMEALLDGPSK
jgi:serine/threonine-protein kinase